MSDRSLETTNTFIFLPNNGSEIAELIRTINWTNTLLGSLNAWPSTLKTTLSMMLNTKFPMFLFWGKDLLCFYNDAYRPSLGKNGKHPMALGKPGEEVWAEIWPLIGPKIKAVYNGSEAFWINDQLLPIYRNGRIEDVYWTYCYSAINGENGGIDGVAVICSETTQQVYTDQKLLEYNQRFENLIKETALGIIVLIGEEMRIDLVNVMYGRLINKTPEEMMGRNLFDIIPEAADPFFPLLKNVMKTGEPLFLYDQPYLVYPNGIKKEGFLNVTYQAYKNVSGTTIGVLALVHDVTEQVLARKIIEEAQSKASLAIESADLGTYEINLQTDEMKTSDRFNVIWGVDHNITRKEFAGLIHPDDLLERQHAFEELAITGNLHYEARILWKDGSEHWARVKGATVYDDAGKPKTLLGVIQDITEQKLFAEKLTEQVKERTQELKRSNEDLLQFAHVASHDLKEPIRKIKTFANRLQSESYNLLPTKSQVFLNKIQNATDRMYAMIEGVLAYSEINSPNQVVEKIDLNKMLDYLETDFEVLLQQKKGKITHDNLPIIEGATILINQLFYNLISNSLKFTRSDRSPVINIQSSIVQYKGEPMVEIVLADNGIGFDQKNADNIFGTFARLHSKDQFEGTGLGLALCKKIVSRHHGTISATGNLDEGAIFTIKLPISQSNSI